MPIRGVIFDLDGTLIDSGLDFDQMRREMEFEAGQPVLETIEGLEDGPRKEHCRQVLRQHEHRGATSAALIPGAKELLAELARRGLPTAVLTRNSREMTSLALDRLGLAFSQVIAREDAPPKPDPAGLLEICRNWRLNVGDVLFVGDFHFDVVAGRGAGILTVLFAPCGAPDYAGEADFVISSLAQTIDVIERFEPKPGGDQLSPSRFRT